MSYLTNGIELRLKQAFVGYDILVNLQELNLEACPRLTDEGVAGLEVFRNLQDLKFGFGNLTNASLVIVGSFVNLKKLDLGNNNKLTDDGLAPLVSLVNLRRLFLYTGFSLNLTLAGLAKFAPLVNNGLKIRTNIWR